MLLGTNLRYEDDWAVNRSLERCSDVLWAKFDNWPDDRGDFFLDQMLIVLQGMEQAKAHT